VGAREGKEGKGGTVHKGGHRKRGEEEQPDENGRSQNLKAKFESKLKPNSTSYKMAVTGCTHGWGEYV
jgi:hypothetical protein